MTNQGLLCYCRPGFELELSAELNALAHDSGCEGFIHQPTPGSGAVLFATQGEGAAVRLAAAAHQLVFARQSIAVFAHINALPRTDRLTPIMAVLTERGERYCDAWVEAPDTDEGKALAAFCKSFGNALIGGLKRAHLLNPPGRSPSASEAMDGRERPTGRSPSAPEAMDHRERPPRRLHAFFPQSDKVYLAAVDPAAAPWPQGIPRLKFPREAPSRSTLKLDEAFLALLDDRERERWLKPGMNAVDLGAAPGGWTWQLVRRSLRVTAIDNGPMDRTLMASGLVTHLREDGFRYRPKKPVDWLVCDMVEKPHRIAELVARWLGEGWCRYAIFNLKLPMKKRYEETQLCLDIVRALARDVRAKQLYHDREEITVFAQRA